MDSSIPFTIRPRLLCYPLYCIGYAILILIINFFTDDSGFKIVFTAICILAIIISTVWLLTYRIEISDEYLVYKSIIKHVSLKRNEITRAVYTVKDGGNKGTNRYFDVYTDNKHHYALRIIINPFSSKDAEKLADILGVKNFYKKASKSNNLQYDTKKNKKGPVFCHIETIFKAFDETISINAGMISLKVVCNGQEHNLGISSDYSPDKGFFDPLFYLDDQKYATFESFKDNALLESRPIKEYGDLIEVIKVDDGNPKNFIIFNNLIQ